MTYDNSTKLNNRDRLRQKGTSNSNNSNNNVNDISNINNKTRALSSKNRIKENNNNNNNYVNNIQNKEYFQNDRAQSSQNNSSMSNKNNIDNSLYKPYTIKEFRELNTANVILGGLGPNTGTKEWEQKNKKMKKIKDYAEGLKTNTKVLMPMLETPDDLIEKMKKDKIESSTRFKALNYGKKVKKKPIVTKYDIEKVNENNIY